MLKFPATPRLPSDVLVGVLRDISSLWFGGSLFSANLLDMSLELTEMTRLILKLARLWCVVSTTTETRFLLSWLSALLVLRTCWQGLFPSQFGLS